MITSRMTGTGEALGSTELHMELSFRGVLPVPSVRGFFLSHSNQRGSIRADRLMLLASLCVVFFSLFVCFSARTLCRLLCRRCAVDLIGVEMIKRTKKCNDSDWACSRKRSAVRL